jgi:hypothetical protein
MAESWPKDRFSLLLQQQLLIVLTMLTTIDSNPHFMNEDKCFRIVEEFIPLLSPCELISFGPQVIYFFWSWSHAPGQIPKYNSAVMADNSITK